MLIWNSIALTLRFIFAFFLVIVLSPVPDTPGSASRELLAMLSRMEGATSIVVWKSQYSLTLFKGASPVKTYWAVFGKGYGDGDKERSGDKRTPEGDFYICSMNHSKRYYKFLGLSYPGIKHAQQGPAAVAGDQGDSRSVFRRPDQRHDWLRRGRRSGVACRSERGACRA